MRALIFAALSVSVLAEESAFSTSVQFLKEEAKSLDLGSSGYSSGVAKGRQLVLQTVLSEVESYGSLSPAAAAALAGIPALLQSILDLITAARDADNTIAGSYVALFAACTDATNSEQTADAAALVTSDGALADLEACATTLATNQGTYDTACGALQTMLNTITTLTCVVPGAPSGPASTQDDADTWITTTTTVTSSFGSPSADGWHQDFEALRPACTAAKNALTSQTSSCYVLHDTFNQAYCSYAQARTTRCDTEGSCYAGHLAAANTFNTAQATRAAQRENDAQVITSLKCLIEQMESNPTGNDLDSWRAACAAIRAADYSSYRGNQADIPTEVTCPDGGVTNPIVWLTVYDTASIAAATFDAALDPTAMDHACAF